MQSRRALANYHFVIPGSEQGRRRRRRCASTWPATPARFVDLITHENIRHGGINNQGMGARPAALRRGDGQLRRPVDRDGAGHDRTGGDSHRRLRRPTHCVAYSKPTRSRGPGPGASRSSICSTPSRWAASSRTRPTMRRTSRHIWRITRPGSQFDWTSRGARWTGRSCAARRRSAALPAWWSRARSPTAARCTSTWRPRPASPSR